MIEYNKNNLLVILGNQLFPLEYISQLNINKVYMKEDIELCTYFKHHKMKLTLFLTAMRDYRDLLEKNDFEIDDALKICLPDMKNIYRWPVIESEIPITMQKKNVVMVGDAAHGMLPYMAQGANKALEDSWELSKCIKEFPFDLSKGLSRYSEERIRRIRRLDKVSHFNEKAYHLEQKMLRRILFVFLKVITVFSPNFFFKRFDWIYKHEG